MQIGTNPDSTISGPLIINSGHKVLHAVLDLNVLFKTNILEQSLLIEILNDSGAKIFSYEVDAAPQTDSLNECKGIFSTKSVRTPIFGIEAGSYTFYIKNEAKYKNITWLIKDLRFKYVSCSDTWEEIEGTKYFTCKCIKGFYFNGQATCSECSINNCLECSNETNCIICKEGFYLSPNDHSCKEEATFSKKKYLNMLL